MQYTKFESQEQFTWHGDKLIVRAPAKINIYLLIAGKRPDGFHEIDTLMSKVNWYDELTIEKRSEPGIEVRCTGTYWAPEGKENLIYKACELIYQKINKKPQIKITLNKKIPAGTGLGSASSDAAATLLGVNKFSKLNLNSQNLVKIAANLGSDVAFFLDGPSALCTGRGEKIKKIQKMFDFSAILIIPKVRVSTKVVYEAYIHDKKVYKNCKEEVERLMGTEDYHSISRKCYNMLETACFDVYENLSNLKFKLQSAGINPVCLSGSGSVMYSLLKKKDVLKLEEYQRMIKKCVDCESVIVSNNRW
ncbi:MAG: 4-(cytidine 5'-diphospho)-2-C-methyl-D-erythritol kinase [Phycisphaerae bacterium]|nr:4-(cytidine 5'-diphospho)-2-C-methyl-D-erythritol kinase [Phycisphaerae bacterium]